MLAPAGCGKTHILTERIRHAHEKEGVAYEDMLCQAFANRGALDMMHRRADNITDDGVENVFVGNVHRFCSKFLFSNGVIPAESSVIDEDDGISILAHVRLK